MGGSKYASHSIERPTHTPSHGWRVPGTRVLLQHWRCRHTVPPVLVSAVLDGRARACLAMFGRHEPTTNGTPIGAASAPTASRFLHRRTRARVAVLGRHEPTADRAAETASTTSSLRHSHAPLRCAPRNRVRPNMAAVGCQKLACSRRRVQACQKRAPHGMAPKSERRWPWTMSRSAAGAITSTASPH